MKHDVSEKNGFGSVLLESDAGKHVKTTRFESCPLKCVKHIVKTIQFYQIWTPNAPHFQKHCKTHIKKCVVFNVKTDVFEKVGITHRDLWGF